MTCSGDGCGLYQHIPYVIIRWLAGYQDLCDGSRSDSVFRWPLGLYGVMIIEM